MSNRKHTLAGVIAVLCLLSGCRHFGGTQKQTFVNDGDPVQLLELRHDSSIKIAMVSHIFGHSAGGPQSGSYSLKTAEGSSEGTYSLASGTLTMRPPNGGKEWSGRMKDDSSFRDEKGNLWRLKNVELKQELHSYSSAR